MTALTLRSYQVDALDAIDQSHREGVQRPLVVHPTGTGKGLEMAEVAGRRSPLGRSLVMVHRQELADQFIEKLTWQYPGLSTGVVKADRNEIDADVVVASVQTIQNEKRSATLGDFATVIVDEAHHAPSPTWHRTLERLGSFSAYGPLTVGFTATPERDGKMLGVWERVVHYYSIRQAIYDGHLVPILPAEVIETNMDLDRIKRTGGDYNEGALGEALEDSGAVEQIADAYVQHAGDRKGVAFTPTVKTAHHLAKALLDRGIPAAALDGGTKPESRRAILAGLRDGSIQVVVNCGVLTEGFDEPSISCVVIARPTSVHGLYIQMIGRGTRLFPGKANLLILDVTGATTRHDLITSVDLGISDEETVRKNEEAERKPCPSCGEPCSLTEHRCYLCHRYLPAGKVAMNQTRHDNCRARAGKVDVFGESRWRWLSLPDGAWCLPAGEEVVVMAPLGPDTFKVASYNAGRITVLHDQMPQQWAMGVGADRARAFGTLAEREARWLDAPVTDMQKGKLVREGLPAAKLPMVRTRGQAADLLTRIQGRRALKKMTTR